MQDVSLLDPLRIAWGSMRYHRNNRSYQILMNVCYLVLHELLLRDERGEARLADVLNGGNVQFLAHFDSGIASRQRGGHGPPRYDSSCLDKKHAGGRPCPIPLYL